MIELAESAWQARAAGHRARLAPVVEPHLARRSHGQRHPVLDFLFDYYRFAPCHLMTWHPGWGTALSGPGAHEFLRHPEYAVRADLVALDATRFPASRRAGLKWVIRLLEATADRPPRFQCFGLHEWAMVYRAEEVRHAQLPLRMDAEALARFVESQQICCSHFDAFRFFTPAARPLNRLQPEHNREPEFEQPGCLHANMDLYKWCSKFQPWVGGDLLAESFLLAVDLRQLDMAASPYDVRELGGEVVPIETETGRAEYAARQRVLADRSAILRRALMGQLSAVQGALPL